MKRKMKDEKMYSVGEVVLVPMKVVKREFDDRGNIKYKLKDQKSAKILMGSYTFDDILPYEQSKTKMTTKEKK